MSRALYPNDDALAVEAATSQRALSTLISRNAYRIASYARRSAGRHWYTADRPDIKQQARLGVCTAVQKFDPERAKFWTYAQHWIRHEVTRWLADCGTVRYPAAEFSLNAIAKVAWLDQPVGEDITLLDVIENKTAEGWTADPSPDLPVYHGVLRGSGKRHTIVTAVKVLDEAAGYVVRRRTIDRASFRRIADEMGTDPVAVAMIERAAMYDMRKAVQLKLFEAA